MRLFQAIRRQGLQMPMIALGGASAVCIACIAGRLWLGAQLRQAYLVWNLFLAWLPLLLAILAADRFARRDTWRDRPLALLAAAWLLFFPNAPYIFTDLVHVATIWQHAFWTDMLLVLLCAFTGFLAGFLSLQLMHRLVAVVWGRWAGWAFVAVVSGLSGFGVYLGRFVRLNSWNVLTHPVRVLEGTTLAAGNVLTQWQHTKFFILFSLFLLLGYVMLFAISHPARTSATLEADRV